MARRHGRRVDRCACRSIHDAEGRRRPVRAWLLAGVAVMSAVGCVSKNETTPDERTLQTVTLPDLSRLEESVQIQLRERYAALTAKRKDPGARAADLATEYGEMGTLLLAAGFHDPAEASLLNA